MSQVHNRWIVMIGDKGAGLAALTPRRVKHEVINDELTLPVKKVSQSLCPGRTLKRVFLLDFLPRQALTESCEFIAQLREFFLLLQQFLSPSHPFVVRNHGMIGHL